MKSGRHFLAFADSRMKPTLARIRSEARAVGAFDSVITCTERDLDRDFRRRHSDILTPLVRGFGYWIWKPQIILQSLATRPANDVLMYCDGGFRFTHRGRHRLDEYFSLAEESSSGLLAFKYFPPQSPFPYDGRQLFDWRNRQWIKGDVLVRFGLREDTAFLDDFCYAGGILLCRNISASREILRQWLKAMESDRFMIDDSPSDAPNHLDFIEHRHDQAVFNCVAHKHKVPALCGYEIQYPGASPQENDWETIRDYPIHARREKTLSHSGRLSTGMQRAWARLRGKA